MKKTGFILCFLSTLFMVSCTEQPSVVVIGAGLSGIAAATKLIKLGYENVKILEAENRIGGRIYSVYFGDGFVDLGGQWISGEKDNIIYKMMEQYSILKHGNETLTIFYSNGEIIDEEIKNDLKAFAKFVDGSNPNVEENCKNTSSTGACFKKLFKPTFQKKYGNNSEKLNIIVDSALWLKHYMALSDGVFSLNELSVKSDYKHCEGDLTLNWNGHGYKTIFDLMMQKFPKSSNQLPIDDKIFLNKEVTKIVWSSNNSNKTLVRCLDGNSFEADHVIFTPSLGVLKARYDEIFEPKLPEEKINAIHNIGYGAGIKIFLYFPEKWWNASAFGFVWSAEDKVKVLSNLPNGPIKDGQHWITSLAFFISSNDNSNVLIGFFSGDLGPDMEKEKDAVLIEGCMYAIRKFLGRKYSVTEPDRILRSEWSANPHFRGIHSYEIAGKRNTVNKYPEKLGTPLKNPNGKLSILFAGEATHPYYFSSGHGSVETGYREADRIINFYNQKQ